MNLLIQDVLVTVVSLGALGWLVQRVVGVVAPVRKSPGRHGCASCEQCEAPARRGPET